MCRIGNQSVDKESTLVVAGDYAEGDAGSHCLMNGLFLRWWKCPESSCGDIALHCKYGQCPRIAHFKMVKMVNFSFVNVPQLK